MLSFYQDVDSFKFVVFIIQKIKSKQSRLSLYVANDIFKKEILFFEIERNDIDANNYDKKCLKN